MHYSGLFLSLFAGVIIGHFIISQLFAAKLQFAKALRLCLQIMGACLGVILQCEADITPENIPRLGVGGCTVQQHSASGKIAGKIGGVGSKKQLIIGKLFGGLQAIFRTDFCQQQKPLAL